MRGIGCNPEEQYDRRCTTSAMSTSASSHSSAAFHSGRDFDLHIRHFRTQFVCSSASKLSNELFLFLTLITGRCFHRLGAVRADDLRSGVRCRHCRLCSKCECVAQFLKLLSTRRHIAQALLLSVYSTPKCPRPRVMRKFKSLHDSSVLTVA